MKKASQKWKVDCLKIRISIVTWDDFWAGGSKFDGGIFVRTKSDGFLINVTPFKNDFLFTELKSILHKQKC